jgi:t-SNARE complex subunit (syntaxin)
MDALLKRHANELNELKRKDEETAKKRVDELTAQYNNIITQLQDKIKGITTQIMALTLLEEQREYNKMENAFNEAAGNVAELKVVCSVSVIYLD